MRVVYEKIRGKSPRGKSGEYSGKRKVEPRKGSARVAHRLSPPVRTLKSTVPKNSRHLVGFRLILRGLLFQNSWEQNYSILSVTENHSHHEVLTCSSVCNALRLAIYLQASPSSGVAAIPENFSVNMEALTKEKTNAWYDARPDETALTPAARALLEKYSGIPPDEVEDHIVAIHDEAWEIFPYPCIGNYRFLTLTLRKFEQYSQILKRLQRSERLLDLGCCFGQEIRQLVADGVPAENLYGCDLRKEYMELGYKLFRDKTTLKSTFITADILDPDSRLKPLKGHFNMIFAGSFFHLWNYAGQLQVSKLAAELLRPEQGSVIFGRQVGSVNATELGDITMFQHNIESFKEMWKQVGQGIGVTFDVDAHLEMPRMSFDRLKDRGADVRVLYFTVTRV